MAIGTWTWNKEDGIRIRNCRLERHLKSNEVAEALGIRAADYCKLELGTAKYPKIETIRKIEEYFGISLIKISDNNELYERINYLEEENKLLKRLLNDKWDAESKLSNLANGEIPTNYVLVGDLENRNLMTCMGIFSSFPKAVACMSEYIGDMAWGGNETASIGQWTVLEGDTGECCEVMIGGRKNVFYILYDKI